MSAANRYSPFRTSGWHFSITHLDSFTKDDGLRKVLGKWFPLGHLRSVVMLRTQPHAATGHTPAVILHLRGNTELQTTIVNPNNHRQLASQFFGVEPDVQVQAILAHFPDIMVVQLSYIRIRCRPLHADGTILQALPDALPRCYKLGNTPAFFR